MRRVGYREEDAGILYREEPFRYVEEKNYREAERREENHQRDEAVAKRDAERPLVSGHKGIEKGADLAVEPARIVLFGLQEPRAQHGRERQRNHHRNRYRDRDGQREFPHQPADDAFHQQKRNEHGYERKTDREHREPDLAGPFQRGVPGLLALLDIAVDVLDDDNRIVHHEAHRDGQRHQRQIVEAEAHRVHDGEGAEQRNRHDGARDERGAPIAQEHQDHQHHERDGEEQRELDVEYRGPDGGRTVADNLHLHSGRDQPF